MKFLVFAVTVVLLFQHVLSEDVLDNKGDGDAISDNVILPRKLVEGGWPITVLKRVRRSVLNVVDDSNHVKESVDDYNKCTTSKRGKQLFRICKNSKGEVKKFTLNRKPKQTKEKSNN